MTIIMYLIWINISERIDVIKYFYQMSEVRKQILNLKVNYYVTIIRENVME